MAWYEKYDLAEDPFGGYEKVRGTEKIVSELVYRVESGSMVFVEGREGSGKTAVLKKLIDEFGGEGKLIFFDCGQIDRKVNIESLMKGSYGFIGRITGRVPKNMVLLLDNAKFLSRKNCERIKHYFDNNFIKAVVFAGVSYAGAKFSDSVRDRIGGRVIRIPALSSDEAVALVRERLKDSGVELLDDSVIRKVYKSSGGNIKKFLTTLSALCDKAVGEGADKVTEEHLGSLSPQASGDLDGK